MEGRKRKSADYDVNGAKLVFEVPTDLGTTVYRYIKQEKFAASSPFNKKYQGDFYPGLRTR